MKREILFRGKDKKGNWHYGDLVHNAFDGTSKNIEIGIRKPNYYPVEVIPETVGQFIGITDKNGYNIFEGDIISNWEFICPLIIGFNNESASFCGSKTNEFETEKCYWFFNDIVMSDGWEIIVNIHDNPELPK